jgi:large conductance mechanosensitive channel
MFGYLSGFMEFIRTQGVVGLAVGFLLGGAVSKVVSALITDIVNPLVGLLFSHTESLKDAVFQIGNSKIMWGDFVSTLLDFFIVAAVVYFGIKGIGLENLDKKKEEKK